jgi:hypothetical protein
MMTRASHVRQCGEGLVCITHANLLSSSPFVRMQPQEYPTCSRAVTDVAHVLPIAVSQPQAGWHNMPDLQNLTLQNRTLSHREPQAKISRTGPCPIGSHRPKTAEPGPIGTPGSKKGNRTAEPGPIGTPGSMTGSRTEDPGPVGTPGSTTGSRTAEPGPIGTPGSKHSRSHCNHLRQSQWLLHLQHEQHSKKYQGYMMYVLPLSLSAAGEALRSKAWHDTGPAVPTFYRS